MGVSDILLFLTCLINAINHAGEEHVITGEAPIKYIHRYDKCIVMQWEILTGAPGYDSASRSALREGPDGALLEEVGNYEVTSRWS